jgi:hypothetical protein
VSDVLAIVAEVGIDDVCLFDRRRADRIPGTNRTACIAEDTLFGNYKVAHYDLPFITF